MTEKLLNHVSGTISGVAAVYNATAIGMREAEKLHQYLLSGLVVGQSPNSQNRSFTGSR